MSRPALGHDHTRVEVIDYAYGVSTLSTIVSYCTGLTERERQRWLKQAEALLYNGNTVALEAKIRELAVGRRAKKVLSHLDYFIGNAGRMRYPELRKRRLPQGSGIVESAIRRVISLRLKSPGKFWLRDNAEGMRHLRSYLKAGHWNELTRRTLEAAIPWTPTHATPPVTLAA